MSFGCPYRHMEDWVACKFWLKHVDRIKSGEGWPCQAPCIGSETDKSEMSLLSSQPSQGDKGPAGQLVNEHRKRMKQRLMKGAAQEGQEAQVEQGRGGPRRESSRKWDDIEVSPVEVALIG